VADLVARRPQPEDVRHQAGGAADSQGGAVLVEQLAAEPGEGSAPADLLGAGGFADQGEQTVARRAGRVLVIDGGQVGHGLWAAISDTRPVARARAETPG